MSGVGIGARRHRLTLQKRMETDGEGACSGSYVAIAIVWAAIEPLSATRIWQAQQVQQQISHRITMAFSADVSGDLRFLSGERIFEIASVFDPDETGRFLVCECLEVRS